MLPLGSSRNAGATSRGERALGWMAVVFVLASLAIVVFSLNARTLGLAATTATALLILAGAASVCGWFLGFLFGIPRALQNSDLRSAQTEVGDTSARAGSLAIRYQANTNLEQISDWLTKIIVGVSLTQIPSIATALSMLSAEVSRGMEPQALAHTIVGASVVLFGILGFLFGYLWTRLSLAEAFSVSDARSRAAQIESAIAITAAKFQSGPPDAASLRQIANLASRLTEDKVQLLRGKQVLWVDDEPEGNIYARRALDSIGVAVTLATSTDEAMDIVKVKHFEAVVTDMGRPGDPRAGYTLLERLRSAHLNVPVFIYSRSGSLPEHRDEALKAGAGGSTNDPKELLGWLLDAAAKTAA
jgi:CheY-like chemotaxis protein